VKGWHALLLESLRADDPSVESLARADIDTLVGLLGAADDRSLFFPLEFETPTPSTSVSDLGCSRCCFSRAYATALSGWTTSA